jgi:microcystin-dependent protein
MSDQFLAEIRIVPFNFAPTGWTFCNGGIMPISQNTALFSLIGTYYGGDGKSTFALPNLLDSVPVHQGQGNGLSPRFLGESGGSPSVTLLQTEIPVHNHVLNVSVIEAEDNDPAGLVPSLIVGGTLYDPANSNVVQMAPEALAPAGGSLTCH